MTFLKWQTSVSIESTHIPSNLVVAHLALEQHPRNTRRNVLPVKLIDWLFLMSHEYTARALVELTQIGKTPSGTDPVFHHAPEAFNRIEVVAAPRWQAMQPKLRVPVGQRHTAAVAHFESADALEDARDRSRADDRNKLQIEPQAARIQIARADDRPFVVDHHGCVGQRFCVER